MRSRPRTGPVLAELLLSKSFDSFGPIGRWLVTRDEIPDPLEIRAYISARLDTVGNTSAMEIDCADLVCSISRAITLEPGDVLATGALTATRVVKDERARPKRWDGCGRARFPGRQPPTRTAGRPGKRSCSARIAESCCW